jgi:hypothetical protein
MAKTTAEEIKAMIVGIGGSIFGSGENIGARRSGGGGRQAAIKRREIKRRRNKACMATLAAAGK